MMARVRLGLLWLFWSLFCIGQVQAEPVEMVLPDLNGVDHKLSSHRGKWVLVNFWATWCLPCIKELPELEAFHQKHKDKDAVVWGVNMEDIGLEQLKAFVRERALTFPILRMEPAPTSPLGEVAGMPTSYLINPEGEIVARQVGTTTAEEIEGFIERYLKDKEGAEKER